MPPNAPIAKKTAMAVASLGWLALAFDTTALSLEVRICQPCCATAAPITSSTKVMKKGCLQTAAMGSRAVGLSNMFGTAQKLPATFYVAQASLSGAMDCKVGTRASDSASADAGAHPHFMIRGGVPGGAPKSCTTGCRGPRSASSAARL